ncbi:MAG: hypothetical protein KKB51_17200 [Candidatus Riflebacteria bacterium]|nr:hypothetical protein [Candidatus Riflebacteria bacterium]
MQKKILIVLVLVCCFFSGLANSQNLVSAESVLKYFASFYIPAEQKTLTRAMLFGQELRPEYKLPVQSSNDLPDRTFFK